MKQELRPRELREKPERRLPPTPEPLRLEESNWNGRSNRHKENLPSNSSERPKKLKLDNVLNSKKLPVSREKWNSPDSSPSDLNDSDFRKSRELESTTKEWSEKPPSSERESKLKMLDSSP